MTQQNGRWTPVVELGFRNGRYPTLDDVRNHRLETLDWRIAENVGPPDECGHPPTEDVLTGLSEEQAKAIALAHNTCLRRLDKVSVSA